MALNVDELIQSEEMLDGLASNLPRVLVCSRNGHSDGQMALEVLGDDLCFGLRGIAVVEKERLDSAPFPSAVVAVRIEECRDHAAAGVKFFGPRYHFHAGKEHRSEVEKKVFAELKGPAPTI